MSIEVHTKKDGMEIKPRYMKDAMPTPGIVDHANWSISWKGKKKRYIQTVLNAKELLAHRR